MSERYKKVITTLCVVGVALNTSLFAMNLFMDLHRLASFNLLCAVGCGIGYIFYQGEEKNDDK